MSKTACSDEESNKKKLKVEDDESDELALEESEESAPSELNKLAYEYGIIERVNRDFKRFSGLIKQSPADFIVNEIDLDHNVVRLTSFDLPVVEKKAENISDLSSRVEKILGATVYNDLIEFLNSNSIDKSFKLEAPSDKTDRKLIHEFFKTDYKMFNSNTVLESNKQMIEINHMKSKNQSSRDSFKNSRVSNEMANFKTLTCAMYKENIDTLQAVSLISRNLRINPKRIGYAGTKDKKGKTTQLISFFKIEPSLVLKLNKNFHNIKLGNFKLKTGDGLRLGDLSGNRFKIVIREVSEQNNDLIKSGIDSLKMNGFLNYFGMQRFGTCVSAPTHKIGKLLLLNNIKEAIDLILAARDEGEFEKQEVKIARHVWNTKRDAKQALACIERINCVEKYLLNGLSQMNSNDHLGAFQFIPRNMRLMYLHAYQSYIWNKMTSKRVELFGFKPVLGDLVRRNHSDKKEEILVLDEKNVNEYSIEHVVLPLPGHSVKYPNNEMKRHYEEALAKDGLNIDGLKNKIKEFSLNGDYRNILTKPEDLTYEIKDYSDKSMQLTKSDFELMNDSSTNENETNAKNGEDKIYKAVVVEYNLPSSAYATMALRELLIDD